MIDYTSGDYAQLLRTPDLRLVGLTWDRFEINRPFALDFKEKERACFYYVKRGGAFFRAGSGTGHLYYVPQGTTVGVEGRPHQWLDRSHLHPAEIERASISSVPAAKGGLADFPFELVMSGIDRSAAVLQRLPHGAIIVPRDAEPFSSMIRGCVDLIELDQASGHSDGGVSRRLAEVIMLQLVGFVQSQIWRGVAPTASALHDEFVLRAMTAFFSQPSHGWTVEALAREAGLSRAAFSERFRKAFDDTPLNTINRLRLQMAADMLKRSNASLADIAQEVGFGSAPAFLRAFTRQFGIRPGQWRSDSRNSA